MQKKKHGWDGKFIYCYKKTQINEMLIKTSKYLIDYTLAGRIFILNYGKIFYN